MLNDRQVAMLSRAAQSERVTPADLYGIASAIAATGTQKRDRDALIRESCLLAEGSTHRRTYRVTEHGRSVLAALQRPLPSAAPVPDTGGAVPLSWSSPADRAAVQACTAWQLLHPEAPVGEASGQEIMAAWKTCPARAAAWLRRAGMSSVIAVWAAAECGLSDARWLLATIEYALFLDGGGCVWVPDRVRVARGTRRTAVPVFVTWCPSMAADRIMSRIEAAGVLSLLGMGRWRHRAQEAGRHRVPDRVPDWRGFEDLDCYIGQLERGQG